MLAMLRALEFAKKQYENVSNYVKSLGLTKPIHIGESGWATISDGHYGPEGQELQMNIKKALYYNIMREWTNAKGISLFLF